MALKAALWGLLAGSTLVLGALIALYVKRINRKAIAVVMAFGAGVLISTLAFNLMDEAFNLGGFDSSTLGFITGAGLFVFGDWWVWRAGGRAHMKSRRKRPSVSMVEEERFEGEFEEESSGDEGGPPASPQGDEGSGMAIFIGALLDGIPESAAIGVGMLTGKDTGLLMVVAVFLSNLPEGVSGAADMISMGRSKAYVLLMWAGIAVVSGLSSLFGYLVLGHANVDMQAFSLALAAGAVLTTVSSTMIPEAFHDEDRRVPIATPLATVAGFLLAFVLTRLAS